MYAKFEENHGLAKRAIKIYERGTEAVLPEERYEVRQTHTQRHVKQKANRFLLVSNRCITFTLNKWHRC